MELLCIPFGLPTTKYLGISPSGFNATGEFDLRNYYDEVGTRQKTIFQPELLRLVEMIGATLPERLDEYGKPIDLMANWSWKSLVKLTSKEEVELLKIESERDIALEQSGIVSASEIRERISKNPTDPFSGIDIELLPELPDAE